MLKRVSVIYNFDNQEAKIYFISFKKDEEILESKLQNAKIIWDKQVSTLRKSEKSMQKICMLKKIYTAYHLSTTVHK